MQEWDYKVEMLKCKSTTVHVRVLCFVSVPVSDRLSRPLSVTWWISKSVNNKNISVTSPPGQGVLERVCGLTRWDFTFPSLLMWYSTPWTSKTDLSKHKTSRWKPHPLCPVFRGLEQSWDLWNSLTKYCWRVPLSLYSPSTEVSSRMFGVQEPPRVRNTVR